MNLFDDEYTEPAGSFSPSRLILARTRRALTQEELAHSVNLDKTTISRYEKGERQPDTKSALALAEFLQFPSTFFYQGGLAVKELEGVSFRSRRSEVKLPTRLRTLSAGLLAAGVIDPGIRKRFRIPSSDVPQVSNISPHMAADQVRAEWGIGTIPVPNMVHMLEAKGIRVFWFSEEDTSVDAVSFYYESTPFILVSSRPRGGERVRMDLAHELGHLVMHRGVEDLSIKQIEDEANAFAAAFLVPEETFRRECPRHPLIVHLFNMKPRFGVSVQALIHRCYDLQIYSESQYKSSFRTININGWRTSEPGQLEWEESRIFEKVFSHLFSQNILPINLAEQLHLPLDELVSLLPIATKYQTLKPNPKSERVFLTLEELGYTPPEEQQQMNF